MTPSIKATLSSIENNSKRNLVFSKLYKNFLRELFYTSTLTVAWTLTGLWKNLHTMKILISIKKHLLSNTSKMLKRLSPDSKICAKRERKLVIRVNSMLKFVSASLFKKKIGWFPKKIYGQLLKRKS